MAASNAAELAAMDQYLAAQEVKDESRRTKLNELVDALLAHKAAGCSHRSCPGPQVSEFFGSTHSHGRYLFVALHMLAEERQK